MAEVFQNTQIRAAGVTTSSSGGAIGITTNKITGISTQTLALGDMVDNTNYLAGTKISTIGAGEVVVDRNSTNTVSASSQSVKFLGVTSCYTAPTASTKAILIGGTFANNTLNSVNLTVEIYDNSASVAAQLASKIPVPSGSSFVISDAGKTVLESQDVIRVYCDASNAIDVNMSILTGVS